MVNRLPNGVPTARLACSTPGICRTRARASASPGPGAPARRRSPRGPDNCPSRRAVHLDDDHAIRIDAERERPHVPEAAHEQARADEQHHGQRGLRDRQRVAHPRSLSAALSHALFERVGEVDARRAPRRQQPDERPTAMASTAEAAKHASIDRRRRPVDPREDDRAREAAQPVRDDQPAGRAGTGEQQRFDEQQAHQTRSPGAERRTQRDLARSAQSAREQQVRDVRAGDQQHDERDAGQPAHDRDFRRLDASVVRRDRRDRHSTLRDVRLGAGVGALMDRRQLFGGLRERDARLQPADDCSHCAFHDVCQPF